MHHLQVAFAYKQSCVTYRQHMLLRSEHMLLFMQTVRQHTPRPGEGVATAPTRMLGSKPLPDIYTLEPAWVFIRQG